MIVLSRIDDRLIHGQVTVGWSRFLEIERIIVISDELADDETQKMLLSMAVPENIEFELYTVDVTASKILADEYVKDKTMLLAASALEFHQLIVKHKVEISELNLGGQRYSGGPHKINESIQITEDSFQMLKAIRDLGVEIDIRTIPTSTKLMLFDVYPVPEL
ncbi:MAG: PTS sugar transporter subunit IIB [Candidatus Lindowbacteria bacterium]|nr:PTS sugar transporter subunit IIB [Candidatus Lindowbacteria bacterium]